MSIPVKPGDLLAGKYMVEQIIGQGGMGVVVSAMHTVLNQRVALKFVLPEFSAKPELVARFVREAQAAARIKGDHVARVMDVGTLENGAAYLVMEFLDGTDLASVVLNRGPLPLVETVDYLLQTCEAIAEAHVCGIVHRDLKPANLFLTKGPDGSPFIKVLDFGISKFANGATTSGLTQSNHIIGSPQYMSPEQMRSSRDVDSKTDIWALGVIVFELLSGRVPFPGESFVEICAAALEGRVPSLRQTRPDLPPAIESIVGRCLRVSPGERFATVADLAIALGEVAPEHFRPTVDRIVRVMQTGGIAVMARSATTNPEISVNKRLSTATAWGAQSGAAKPARRALPIALVFGGGLAVGIVGIVAATRFATSHRTAIAPVPTASASLASESAPQLAPPAIATVAPPVRTAEAAPPAPTPVEVVPSTVALSPSPMATAKAAATERPKGSSPRSDKKSAAAPQASAGRAAPPNVPASEPADFLKEHY